MPALADPTNWYNTSYSFRSYIPTVYALTLFSVVVSVVVGWYGKLSESQLAKDSQASGIATVFGVLFCIFLLNHLLSNIGQEKLLTGENHGELRYFNRLLNSSIGISVIVIVIDIAAINVTYLLKRLTNKFKGDL